jgi:phage N-6-adenine-methyltransferase
MLSLQVTKKPINKRRHLSSKADCWNTPKDLFDWLNLFFSFEIDAAANFHNALLDNFWCEGNSAFDHDWNDKIIFCNPPYGRAQVDWIKRAAEAKGGSVVMLIPVRADTAVWHDVIYPKASAILFVRGRLKFTLGDVKNDPAFFASAVVVFGKVPPAFKALAHERGFLFCPNNCIF